MTAGLTSSLAAFVPVPDAETRRILKGQAKALNRDFGPDGWSVFVSDGGLFYACISERNWPPVPRPRECPARTECEPDARSMRETLARRVIRLRAAEPSADDLLGAYGDDL